MLAFWGDSIFKGVIFSDNKYTLCGGTVDKLANFAADSIKNYSRFGMDTGKALRLFTDTIGTDDSSGVCLEFGGNDCDYDWKQVSQNPHMGYLPKTPIKIFASNMESMIMQAQSLGKKVYLCSLPPIYSPYYFDFISQNLNADNILYWLGDKEHIFRHHEKYSIAVTALAKKHNTEFIDLRADFLQYKDYHKLLCIDGIHPNIDGQQIIYDRLSKCLQPVFSKASV